MITEITTNALKGVTGTFTAGKLNIITGDNGSGKTAVTDAIRLALLGEHPEIGKTAAALFQMASGPAMGVRLAFDKAPAFARNWNLKGKTVKMTTEGDEPEASSAPLNVREFLSANAKTRLKMVMEAGGTDAASVAAERLTEAGYDDVATFEAMEAKAVEYEKDAADYRAVAKRFSGMLEGTAVVDAQQATTVAPDLKAAQAAVASARAAYTAARERYHKMTEAQAAADDAKERMPEDVKGWDINVIQANLIEAGDGIATFNDDRAESQHRLQELLKEESALAVEEAKLASAPASDPAEIDRIQALPFPTHEEVDAARIEAKERQQERMNIDGDMRSWGNSKEAAEREREGFEGLECCPTCKAAAPGWKAEVLRAMDTKVASFHILLTAGHAALKKAQDAEMESAQRFAELSDAYAERQRLPSLEQGLAAGIQIQHTRRRLEEVRGMVQAMQARVKECDHQIEGLKLTQSEYQSMQTAMAQAEALQTFINQEPGEDALTEAHAAMDAAENAMEQAEQAQEEAQDAALQQAREQEREANMRTAREEMDKATEEAAAATEKAKYIRKVMQEEMADAFYRITAAAGKMEGIAKLEMVDGMIGRWHGGTFAPFDALSGTEQLLATVAIQVGLQGGKDALVMIDELSRLTAENKTKLREAIEGMVEVGQIDQAFVIDHDPSAWTAENWTRIEPKRTV